MKNKNTKCPWEDLLLAIFFIYLFWIVPIFELIYSGENPIIDAFKCDDLSNRFTCHWGFMVFLVFFIPILFISWAKLPEKIKECLKKFFKNEKIK